MGKNSSLGGTHSSLKWGCYQIVNSETGGGLVGSLCLAVFTSQSSVHPGEEELMIFPTSLEERSLNRRRFSVIEGLFPDHFF